MTSKHLRDLTYRVATASCTIKELTYQEWRDCNLEDVLWDPLETCFEPNFTGELVEGIASEIFLKFSHLIDKGEINVTTS